MAKRKQLSAADMQALAAYADDKVHDVWAATESAQGGAEATPTLAQIAALARLGTAYHQLASTLLTHAQMEDDRRALEARLRAEITSS